MRENKDAAIIVDVSVTKLNTSLRRLLTLINKASELLYEYRPCILARIYKRNSERYYRIALKDEKGKLAHLYECHLKNEGTKSRLVKISVDD